MAQVPEWFFLLATGLFGLLFGSLANVIIWRVPHGESIVAPGSHCPSCGSMIRWYDNVPVVSWFVLRARCRDCGGHISARYPAVELLSGFLWVVAALKWGMSVRTVFGITFFYLLLVLTFIDLDTLRLPNILVATIAGAGAVGVIVSATGITPAAPLVPIPMSGVLSSPIVYALFGAMLGAGVSGLVAAAYSLVRGTAGLGMGDVKLLGALGIFLGPYVLIALVVGSVLGALVGIGVLRGGADASQTRIPFGPFLAAGAFLVALVGPAVWTWYAVLTGIA